MGTPRGGFIRCSQTSPLRGCLPSYSDGVPISNPFRRLHNSASKESAELRAATGRMIRKYLVAACDDSAGPDHRAPKSAVDCERGVWPLSGVSLIIGRVLMLFPHGGFIRPVGVLGLSGGNTVRGGFHWAPTSPILVAVSRRVECTLCWGSLVWAHQTCKEAPSCTGLWRSAPVVPPRERQTQGVHINLREGGA